MSWIKDMISPKTRQWEEFYRNRWQYDKVVRSTHGVNCTGGCSWNIHVKEGIVVWEMQALDYPLLENSLPPYEPRGCQRGISFSWYLYSPVRIKYPMIRGALLTCSPKKRKKPVTLCLPGRIYRMILKKGNDTRKPVERVDSEE